ncbi:lysine-rich nucleolar protein 1 [Cinclus cinclus]|uniref:lysine-rich nucleolar protein 1 n=1 Tax=Cinclus cinclus TaxID=127875 RepID=UPI002E15A798
MVIKKKRQELHEKPVQKKVKTIIKIEKDVQTVIKTENNGHLKKKKKKENLKDECLHKLQPKNSKKNKKKKVGSELLREAHLESFLNMKSHLGLQLQEESEEQIKILKKKKEKVQCRFSLENNESSDMELSNHHTDGSKKKELSLKRKRKNTALDMELDGVVTKKKKKKGTFSLEDIQDSEQKKPAKVCKNTHKHISQEAVFMGENYDTGNAQNGEGSCVRRKKKKKKNKEKSHCFLPLADNEENIHQVPGSPTALNDFRKRKKHNSWEFTLTSREEEDKIKNFRNIKEGKKKKKKRKYISSSACEEDKPDCSHSIPDKHLPAQQEVELSGKKQRKNFKDNNEVSKKKKKKIKKKEEETAYSEVSLYNDNASKSQKILPESNKKNKESELERALSVTGDAVDEALCNSNPVLCDRKRKKRKTVPPQDLAEEPGSKAGTKTIKTESPWTESLEHLDGVIIVREKKGNCDEISIDKVRRQALQEEIDRESGKTKAFSSKVEQDTKLGQWSTATFKSSAEQMKFFRLMGGFKKGSVPIQNPSATTNKPNMALNMEGEEKLQQALKMEFDKAMDLKQHRGIGLGFQPTANKKVYIDKYTSRSVKFED